MATANANQTKDRSILDVHYRYSVSQNIMKPNRYQGELELVSDCFEFQGYCVCGRQVVLLGEAIHINGHDLVHLEYGRLGSG